MDRIKLSSEETDELLEQVSATPKDRGGEGEAETRRMGKGRVQKEPCLLLAFGAVHGDVVTDTTDGFSARIRNYLRKEQGRRVEGKIGTAMPFQLLQCNQATETNTGFGCGFGSIGFRRVQAAD